jgi:hypothetical protein
MWMADGGVGDILWHLRALTLHDKPSFRSGPEAELPLCAKKNQVVFWRLITIDS